MLNDASYKVVKQLEAGIHGNIMTMTNWKNRKESCNLLLQWWMLTWLFVDTAEPINVFNVSSQCWSANVAWQKAVIYTATHPTRIVATFTKWRCSKAYVDERLKAFQNQDVKIIRSSTTNFYQSCDWKGF